MRLVTVTVVGNDERLDHSVVSADKFTMINHTSVSIQELSKSKVNPLVDCTYIAIHKRYLYIATCYNQAARMLIIFIDLVKNADSGHAVTDAEMVVSNNCACAIVGCLL